MRPAADRERVAPHRTGPLVRIFATPKAFEGDFDRIQRNAVWSWARLRPAVEVLLIGDDHGTAQVALEAGAGHQPRVARSPRNVPLLDDLWRIGQHGTPAPLALFANADIMFTDDLVPALEAVRSQAGGPFLAVGQRWDVDGDHRWWHSPPDPGWDDRARRWARSEGRLSSPLWIDWFAFPAGQYPSLPPFVVGRPGYDHWLVWHTLQRRIPVVDATGAVTAIHQRHDYSHGGGRRVVWSGPDAATNRLLIGGRRHMRTIGNATHRLGRDGVLRPSRGLKYRLAAAQCRLGPALEATASLRHRVGLDAEVVQRMARHRARG
jgi:hypothetical protein